MKIRISKDSINLITKEIKKWESKKREKTFAKLGEKLNVSRQTASLWYKKYKTGKLERRQMSSPKNKYNNVYNQWIADMYKKDAEELENRLGKQIHNPTIMDFALYNNVNCSKEHIRKVLINNGLFYARMKRKTRKEIKKNLRNKLLKINDSKIKSELENQLKTLKKYKPLVKKQGIAGHILEIDACEDLWTNYEKQYIYFAIDAFTNTLLGMWVEKEETTMGYIVLLKEVFKNHGLPYEIKCDKRRSFWGSEHTMTHIGNMLNELGVKLSVSSTATFKPNVERSFENAQNLLPYFYMKNKINTKEDMISNIDVTIEHYNKRYKYSMKGDNSLIACDPNMIDNIMTLKTTRKVTNGNVVSLNGSWVAPYNGKGRVLLKPFTKIEILTNTKSENYSIIDNKKCIWKKLIT